MFVWCGSFCSVGWWFWSCFHFCGFVFGCVSWVWEFSGFACYGGAYVVTDMVVVGGAWVAVYMFSLCLVGGWFGSIDLPFGIVCWVLCFVV